MNVYIAKVYKPYEENLEMVGIFSTEEKASDAIGKELKHYQGLTGRSDEDIKRFNEYSYIGEYTLDAM